MAAIVISSYGHACVMKISRCSKSTISDVPFGESWPLTSGSQSAGDGSTMSSTLSPPLLSHRLALMCCYDMGMDYGHGLWAWTMGMVRYKKA